MSREYEPTPTQLKILNCLYFVEPFEHILAETNLPKPILSDELKTLLSNRLVAILKFDNLSNDWLETNFYDSDKLDSYAFRATSAGLITS